jgi:hypothetical protein
MAAGAFADEFRILMWTLGGGRSIVMLHAHVFFLVGFLMA